MAASARGATAGVREVVAEVFDPPLTVTDASLAFDGMMSLLRGLALGSVVRDRPEREQQILRLWLEQFAVSKLGTWQKR